MNHNEPVLPLGILEMPIWVYEHSWNVVNTLQSQLHSYTQKKYINS